MTLHDIAAARQRVESVLRRRPQSGISDDAPATARWEGGMRVVSRHANGTQLPTDMPTELGGSGDQVSPGWLFRAGLASCAATSIAMAAANDGVALTRLEVRASSRSDARGLLGLPDVDGAPVFAGPSDVTLHVRIAASAVPPERLRALVDASLRSSPIPSAVEHALPVALHVDVEQVE